MRISESIGDSSLRLQSANWAGNYSGNSMLLRKASLNVLRILVPVVFFGASAFAGLAYLSAQPIMFESQGKVLLRPRIPYDPDAERQAIYLPLVSFFNSPITTAAELMKSGVVLDKAASLLKQRDPGIKPMTAADIVSGLKVESVKDADVIVARFANPNPHVAQEVAQAVLDGFIEVNNSESRERAIRSRVLLEGQCEAARQDYLRTVEQIRQYKLGNNIADVDIENGSLLSERSQTEHDLQRTTAAIARLKRTIKPLKDLTDRIHHSLTHSGQGAGSLPDERTNSDLQKAVERLVQAKADLIAEQQSLVLQKTHLAKIVVDRAQLLKHRQKLDELEILKSSAGKHYSDMQARLANARIAESAASPVPNIQVVDYPREPFFPTSPNIAGVMGCSLFLGIVFSLGSLYILYLIDPSLKQIQSLKRLFSARLFAGFKPVPRAQQLPSLLLPMHRLRLALKDWFNTPHRRIIVTSPDVHDGKGAVALGLALSLARSGTRVLLVDADLNQPSLHAAFKMNTAPGICDYVASPQADLLPKITHLVEPNLWFIPAGAVAPIIGILESANFHQLLKPLQDDADVVILNTASVSESTDALSLVEEDARVLLVVRMGYTSNEPLSLASTQFQQLKTDRLAVVINDIDETTIAGAVKGTK